MRAGGSTLKSQQRNLSNSNLNQFGTLCNICVAVACNEAINSDV